MIGTLVRMEYACTPERLNVRDVQQTQEVMPGAEAVPKLREDVDGTACGFSQ